MLEANWCLRYLYGSLEIDRWQISMVTYNSGASVMS
jgi:hypothetical protein